ncbi:MAG: hypothetical protein ABI629_19610 [bacterium]
MRAQLIALVVVASAMFYAASARAQLEPVQVKNPDPGTALATAALDVIFVPVRVGVTAVGAALGGLTGWLTAGNRDAARSVWYVFDGPQVLQPDMLYGKEAVALGDLQFNMHLTDPR